MRRYRNARYAPESLERKLNPSTMGIAPPPALVGLVAAPTDIIYSPTLAAPAPAPTDVIYAAPAMMFPTAAPTAIVTATPVMVAPTAAPTDFIPTAPLVMSAPTNDYLLVDNELPTLPGEGPLVPLVPNPTGPVVPA